MLSGGPIHFYIKKFIDRKESLMIMNGFQVDGTVGRTLLDTGRYVHEGTDQKPRMGVEFHDLSAHCGKDEIKGFIKQVNPGKTFLVHGERTVEFAKELGKDGFNAEAPENGQSINLD